MSNFADKGNFHTHANLTQTLCKIVEQHYTAVNTVEGQPPQALPHFMSEALHMICSNVSSVVNGNANSQDNWKGIAEYAVQVVKILEAVELQQKAAAQESSEEPQQ